MFNDRLDNVAAVAAYVFSLSFSLWYVQLDKSARTKKSEMLLISLNAMTNGWEIFHYFQFTSFFEFFRAFLPLYNFLKLNFFYLSIYCCFSFCIAAFVASRTFLLLSIINKRESFVVARDEIIFYLIFDGHFLDNASRSCCQCRSLVTWIVSLNWIERILNNFISCQLPVCRLNCWLLEQKTTTLNVIEGLEGEWLAIGNNLCICSCALLHIQSELIFGSILIFNFAVDIFHTFPQHFWRLYNFPKLLNLLIRQLKFPRELKFL